jgi:hypothetical protein
MASHPVLASLIDFLKGFLCDRTQMLKRAALPIKIKINEITWYIIHVNRSVLTDLLGILHPQAFCLKIQTKHN